MSFDFPIRSIGRRWTFDSSKTPEVGVTVMKPKVMTKVDLEGLKATLLTSIDSAKLEDPAMLRAQIAELKEKLAKASPRPFVPKRVANTVHDVLNALKEQTHALAQAFETIRLVGTSPGDGMAAVVNGSHGSNGALRSRSTSVSVQKTSGMGGSAEVVDRTRRTRRHRWSATMATETEDSPKLRKGERRIMEAAIRYHPVRLTRAQLASLAKLTTTSGTYGAYLSNLFRVRYLEETDALVGVTAAGLAYAGVRSPKPLTREERIATWMGALRAGERKILTVVLERGEISCDELARAAELTANAGTFGAYLSTLRRNALVSVHAKVASIGSAIGPDTGR